MHTSTYARRPPVSHVSTWFALGASAALAIAAVPLATAAWTATPPATGPVAVWAVDRDAHQLYGLDRDLYIAKRTPIDWPLDVEACRDGGTWVLRSGNGVPGATHRLDRLDHDGNIETELFLNACVDLATLDGEQALVVETGAGPLGEPRVVRVRREGSIFPLHVEDGLACVAGAQGSVLAGTRSGSIVRLAADHGELLDRALVGGILADIAAGPEPGSVFVLDASPMSRVLYLDRDLTLRWSVAAGYRALHLAAVPGEERVWVASIESPCVSRFGPGGVLEMRRRDLPLGGFDRALAWTNGSVLLTSPGAIVHVDASGALAPGQGGFDHIADLAAVL